MAGRCRKVLRFVSPVALVVLVAAGCGGSSRPDGARAPGVPRLLAQRWEAQAAAVAGAAAAGNNCRASQLAASLRAEVISAEPRVPRRLYTPLVTGVRALTERITCTPLETTKPPHKPPPKPPPKPAHKPPPHHHDHGPHEKGHK